MRLRARPLRGSRHHGAVSKPWPAPADLPSAPADLPSARPQEVPRPAADAAAGVVTTVGVVLLGAPLGLLWAAVSPRAEFELRGTDPPSLAEGAARAFLDADVAFGGLALLAGLVSGALAGWLGRRHGPAVVLGLVTGGLLAAYVASRTGRQVGRDAFLAAVRDPGGNGRVEAAVQLFTPEAVVAWPVGALLSFGVLLALLTRRGGRETPAPAASSG